MKLTDSDYPNALEAAVLILQDCARRKVSISYGELSAALEERGFDSIPPHRGVMTYLLRDVCLFGNADGRAPMLSALVVNKASREPSEQFSTLARTLPFSRPSGWTWRDEQDRVFAAFGEG